jgi:plastocyanin
LNKRGMIIPVLLVIFITVGLSLGETSGTMDNATAPAGDENGTAAENETVGQNATAANAVNLNYIWSVTGLEAEPVIMVLNQDGNDLYGAAKYEPDSGSHWNADVIGSISDDNVDLTLTAQVDEKLVTTKLDGFFDNASQTLDGKFTEVSGGKIANKGNFSAMWINPDTSSYTPAEIEQPKSATQQTAIESATVAIPNSIEITSSSFRPNSMTVQVGTTVVWINHDTKDQAIAATNGEFDSGNIIVGGQYQYTFSQQGTFDYSSKTNPSMTGKIIVTGNSKSRFVDVHEYADKIGPGGDLSGVPPGMGGSGLGA